MIPGFRGLTLMAGMLGLSGIILAAMGAHLEGGIDNFLGYRHWQSANLMHLVHALALLGLAALERTGSSRWWGISGLLMISGTVLFSGSIYVSVLLDTPTVLAPLGGICLMVSWALMAGGAISSKQ